MSRDSITSEVVEDSEPEREESRRREQKNSAKRPSQIQSSSEFPAKINSAKPISSEDTGDLFSKDSWATFNGDSDSVIEISDDESRGPSTILQKGTDSTSVLAQTTAETRLAAICVVSSESSSDSDGENQLKLNRFAFQKPSRLRLGKAKSSTSSSAQGQDPSVESELPAKPTGRAITSHRFADDFSDADLAKLSKCVCCDLAWTTRKSVAQKMFHILSCARKHSLKDDTIKILIHREVENAPATKWKRKVKAIDPEKDSLEVPDTFMEHFVGRIEPKKKGRRVGATVTVRAAGENEEANRARARVILGNCGMPHIQEAVDQQDSEFFGPSKLAVQLGRKQAYPDDPPCTQAFGDNALRQRQQSTNDLTMQDIPIRREMPTYPVSSDDDMVPPPAQHFAASKLATLHQPSFLINPVTLPL